MSEINFTERDWIIIYASIVLGVLAFGLIWKKKMITGMLVLTCSGLLLRVVMLTVDPFLNMWDEQYHALVAKNLAEHFFIPTLVNDPAQTLAPGAWTYTHIWLHKPPLFLWQMAMSIKLFGATPWAIRIPSCFLTALMIPVLFRMGKLLANKRVGIIAATLFAYSNILVCLVTGFLNTDHNDLAFLAYTCFSVWTWMEYQRNPSLKWILLTGVFAGAAVLTKWLPGMMVFGAWFASLITSRDKRIAHSEWRNFAISFVTAIIVAAPWFVYAGTKWPESFYATMNIYSDHFDGDMSHGGKWWFHFATFVEHHGWLFALVALSSVFHFTIRAEKKEFKSGLLALLITVFAFYSFVPTRMPLFCLPMFPLVILIVGWTLDHIATHIKHKIISVVFVVVVVSLLVITPIFKGRSYYYHEEHGMFNAYHDTRTHNRLILEQTLQHIPQNALVYNCPLWSAVPCMFYTGHTASDQLPSESELKLANEKQRPVYVFDDGKLPERLINNSTIKIIQADLIRNGF